ncbi:MAG: uroporphyrinogen decarboxylase [Deltaproteobacteria bacterium]|nr:MAG: uroporphyrinogen decarboxylase [Deltaproteobacteria bacterium]
MSTRSASTSSARASRSSRSATARGTALAGRASPAISQFQAVRLTPTQRLLRACRGEPVDRPPVWLMRQAGRYLPDYRRVREQVSFLELCRDVDRAVEVSLQPIDAIGSEAVIFFSDIFTPIPGMGVDVDFRPGPVVAAPIRSAAQVERLRVPDPRESVPFVFEILRALRGELAAREIPLLGFAGAPFTLASYLVEGAGSRHFGTWKRMLWREPATARALLDRLTDLTVAYLGAQIEAGAQAVQIFDTWAGMLSPADYREWVLPTHREIAAKLDRSAPLILYVNDGAHVLEETAKSGADVISLDWRVDLADAARRVGSRVSLQGNLDPCALAADAATIAQKVRELARDAAPARGWIANLGHGCLPDTPVEGVRAFTDAVRGLAP